MASYSFYTIGGMSKVVCDSATSEGTGRPKENLIDLNPDVYWNGTSTADQTLDFDLQAAKAVDAWGMYIINPTNAGGGTFQIRIQSSDDDSAYTTRSTFDLSSMAADEHIQVVDFAATYTHRYWRVFVENQNAVTAVSMLWLFRKRTVAVATQLPANDSELSHNKTFDRPDGRSLVRGLNTQRGKIFRLTYLLGETDWTALKAAHADSHGSRYPLILDDGTTQTLVRFTSDTIDPNQLDYQYYNPTVELVAVPFIAEGESY